MIAPSGALSRKPCFRNWAGVILSLAVSINITVSMKGSIVTGTVSIRGNPLNILLFKDAKIGWFCLLLRAFTQRDVMESSASTT